MATKKVWMLVLGKGEQPAGGDFEVGSSEDAIIARLKNDAKGWSTDTYTVYKFVPVADIVVKEPEKKATVTVERREEPCAG